MNLPFAVAVLVASRHVPETRGTATEHLDLARRGRRVGRPRPRHLRPDRDGSGRRPSSEWSGWPCSWCAEARSPEPMLPLALFRNRQFSGANATTLAVYAALGGAFFLLVLELQVVLGYSRARGRLGAAAGDRADARCCRPGRVPWPSASGPRIPMTIGPLGVAGGLLLWTRVDAGSTYVGAVLPGAIVFGLGLSLTVAPLTATIMASADEEHLGVASGVNNAVARLAGLLAVALLPTRRRASTPRGRRRRSTPASTMPCVVVRGPGGARRRGRAAHRADRGQGGNAHPGRVGASLRRPLPRARPPRRLTPAPAASSRPPRPHPHLEPATPVWQICHPGIAGSSPRPISRRRCGRSVTPASRVRSRTLSLNSRRPCGGTVTPASQVRDPGRSRDAGVADLSLAASRVRSRTPR